MRERLVELLKSKSCWNNDCPEGGCEKCDYIAVMNDDAEHIADCLLANGVVVPPCKVGQILYVIEAGKINEAKVKEYKYCSNSNNGIHWHIIFEELFVMSEAHIGKTVFLSREDAERALKGEKK